MSRDAAASSPLVRIVVMVNIDEHAIFAVPEQNGTQLLLTRADQTLSLLASCTRSRLRLGCADSPGTC